MPTSVCTSASSGGDIALADAADLHALDQVAGIGVTASILIAHVRHDEHDADLARRHADDAHRGDVSRLLLFDPGRQLGEARAIEWSAGDPRDVFLEARTEAAEVEPGYLRRGDDGAVGGSVGCARAVNGTASRASTRAALVMRGAMCKRCAIS